MASEDAWRLSSVTAAVSRDEFLALLEAAARAQGCTHYTELRTHGLNRAVTDTAIMTALDRVEGCLGFVVRQLFPEDEWIVLRSDANNSCIFRGQAGRGLHVDATTTSRYLRLCCHQDVIEELAHLDEGVLREHVRPVNMWMLLEGARALLAAPGLGASMLADQLTVAEEEILTALANGQPVGHGALLFPSRGTQVSTARLEVLCFDGSRVQHCGLGPADLCARGLVGATGAADMTATAAVGTSVDFRKVAIRRAATTWGGGMIDLTPIAAHVLYGQQDMGRGSARSGSGPDSTSRGSTSRDSTSTRAAPLRPPTPPATRPPAADCHIDCTQLLFRMYRTQILGTPLTFWATADVEDVFVCGCELVVASGEAQSLPGSLFADDTPGEKVRTGMVFEPTVALCAALAPLLALPAATPTFTPAPLAATPAATASTMPQWIAAGCADDLAGNVAAPAGECVQQAAPRPRLLEMGAGVGLVGLWAAARGAEVFLTDRSRATLELLARSTALLAASQVMVRPLEWGVPWGARPSWLDRHVDLVVALTGRVSPSA